MTYGLETWVVRKVEEGVLSRVERLMVRKICGVTLADRVRSAELMERIGLKESVIEVVRRSSLRWFKVDGACVDY